MKSVRKNLSINIEYGDMNEALEALAKITRAVKAHKVKYDRQKENTAVWEYAIDNVTPDDYREEYINGTLCQVFKSKM